jgi:hypothetical protein
MLLGLQKASGASPYYSLDKMSCLDQLVVNRQNDLALPDFRRTFACDLTTRSPGRPCGRFFPIRLFPHKNRVKKDHRLHGDGLALYFRQPGNFFPC